MPGHTAAHERASKTYNRSRNQGGVKVSGSTKEKLQPLNQIIIELEYKMKNKKNLKKHIKLMNFQAQVKL